MKTSVIAFYFLVMGPIGLCQDPETILSTEKINSPTIHYAYVKKIENECLLNEWNHLRAAVVRYDIKQSDVFDGIESYRVTFSNGKDTVVAIYGPDGEIERTFEYYKDVRIPKPILKKVLAEYVNWRVLESVHLVFYGKTTPLEEKFKVKMERNGKQIWLRYTLTDI